MDEKFFFVYSTAYKRLSVSVLLPLTKVQHSAECMRATALTGKLPQCAKSDPSARSVIQKNTRAVDLTGENRRYVRRLVWFVYFGETVRTRSLVAAQLHPSPAKSFPTRRGEGEMTHRLCTGCLEGFLVLYINHRL